MKKIIISLILTSTLFTSVNAQVDSRELYQHKVKVYTRMKNAGWTMSGIGGGLIIAGTALIISLPDNYWYADYEEDTYYDIPGDELVAIGGIMCLGIGVGLLAGGITVGSIGTHKLRQYKTKLDNLSIAPVISPKVQGFTLVYRF